jgi:teichuronic acid biosynthesis glycosyltransferase TuaG
MTMISENDQVGGTGAPGPLRHGDARRPRPQISVVITTFERPDACERALRSVLAQTEAAMEVLVCDNGSSDETQPRFEDWARRCEMVRYLRLPQNSGGPAPARNLGVRHARGDWIAFLDDDDRWLPAKLARQRAVMAAGPADVVATNALRGSGELYFPDAPPVLRPSRNDLLRSNPVITSSVVMRRRLAGFPTAPWLNGVEDYAAWLALADRGASFLVLGEPLLRYDDRGANRLSSARAKGEFAVALLALRRAARRPERATVRTAARKTAGAIYVAACDGVASLRARSHNRKQSNGI